MANEYSLVSIFIAETNTEFPEPVDAFKSIVAGFGDDIDAIAQSAELLTNWHYLGCAELCFERIIHVSPTNFPAWGKLISALFNQRKFAEALDLVERLFSKHGIIHLSLLDDILNRALWSGKHKLVSNFFLSNQNILAFAIKEDPDGYIADALISYACEAEPGFLNSINSMYEKLVGHPISYLKQLFSLDSQKEKTFMFASHGFAGTGIFFDFFPLIGVRLDRISYRWSSPNYIDENIEFRRLSKPYEGKELANTLRRGFLFQTNIRCYCFDHRLPNPERVGDTLGFFVIRDPRVSIKTWGKPTTTHIQNGSFSRFVSVRAQDWCDFVDVIDKMQNKLIVRFEDWKANPRSVAEQIVSRIGITTRISAIEEAIYLTDTNLARQFKNGLESVNSNVSSSTAATDEQLDEAYRIIENICGDRLNKYGYSNRIVL